MTTPQPLFLLFCLWGASLFAQQDNPQNTAHPAFAERVAERERMVRDHIENYPYNPVK